MNILVVDSSVAIKWFIFEVQSEEAIRWRSASAEMHSLAAFFDLEIANVLWKKMRRDALPPATAKSILSTVRSLSLTRHDERPLLDAAFDLAIETQRTVYDCLHLALAVKLDGRLLTADQKLLNSLLGTRWARHLVWVGDQPNAVENI